MPSKEPNAKRSALISDPEAMRAEALGIWERAVAGGLSGIAVDPSRLKPLSLKVAAAMQDAYPDMQFPPLGCWRVLESGDLDRWGIAASGQGFESAEEMLLAAADLAILSGTMKVAPPEEWDFVDPFSGERVVAEKALDIAALVLMTNGYTSSSAVKPLQVDAQALMGLTSTELAQALQMDPVRHEGWLKAMLAQLLRLGEVIAMRPDLFEQHDVIRPGNVVLVALQEGGEDGLSAEALFKVLFNGLAPLWPGGAAQGDLIFADAWEWGGSEGKSIASFQLPLSEIIYSLVEPLAWAGLSVDKLDMIPPLTDLTHAALLAAEGIISLSVQPDEIPCDERLETGTALRLLTLAALELLARELREYFQTDADSLPLTLIQQAGTHPLGGAALLENSSLEPFLTSFLAAGGVFWLPFRA